MGTLRQQNQSADVETQYIASSLPQIHGSVYGIVYKLSWRACCFGNRCFTGMSGAQRDIEACDAKVDSGIGAIHMRKRSA
jgi:hypothetical protein